MVIIIRISAHQMHGARLVGRFLLQTTLGAMGVARSLIGVGRALAIIRVLTRFQVIDVLGLVISLLIIVVVIRIRAVHLPLRSLRWAFEFPFKMKALKSLTCRNRTHLVQGTAAAHDDGATTTTLVGGTSSSSTTSTSSSSAAVDASGALLHAARLCKGITFGTQAAVRRFAFNAPHLYSLAAGNRALCGFKEVEVEKSVGIINYFNKLPFCPHKKAFVCTKDEPQHDKVRFFCSSDAVEKQNGKSHGDFLTPQTPIRTHRLSTPSLSRIQM